MKLYYVAGNAADVPESKVLSSLSGSRRAQIEHRPYVDRMVSAVAAILLRYAMCNTGNRAFCDAPIVWEGKPHFADPIIPLYFNFSHTTDKASENFAAAVLLSEHGEVGVDLEFVHTVRNRDALMRRLFTETEREYVLSSGNAAAFFDIWCAKEAFVKYMGEGFSRRLSTVNVDIAKKTAVSGSAACDLVWFSIGKSQICCAVDAPSLNVEAVEISMEMLLSILEE